jgi:hypothetical protein
MMHHNIDLLDAGASNIKRASAEDKDSWTSPAKIFEFSLEVDAPT